MLLLVDRGSIGRGGGREVMKAAERFLGTLAPADRVGLAFVPGPGKFLEFTADVDLVRQGLKGVVGTADRGGSQVPLAEAVAYVKNRDRLRWSQWVELQCDFRSSVAGGRLPAGDGSRGRPGLPRLPRPLALDACAPSPRSCRG